MADSTTKGQQGNATGANSERMKKAAATRRITAEKKGKLGLREQYAFDKINDCRSNLDKLAKHVLNGGTVTPELLARVADLDGQIGLSMFE